jgi:formate dehydrogenase iron-sulfur subunit
MADPQRRLHALRRSGLLESLLMPGAIVQYPTASSIRPRQVHRLRYCIKGCPFNIPRLWKVDHKAYRLALLDRVAVGQVRLRPHLPDACDRFGSRRDDAARPSALKPKVAWLPECRPLRSAGRRWQPCDVRAAARGQARNLREPAKGSADQPDCRSVERADEVCRYRRHGAFAAIGGLHYVVSGPNKVQPKDEEDAKRLTGVR